MYAAHGWATIWPSYKNDDTAADLLDDDKMEALRQQIADHIQELGLNRTEQRMKPFAEIRTLDYQIHLWLSGSDNYAVRSRIPGATRSDQHAEWHETILDLFNFIAAVAPGSYGLLYVEHDEGPEHPNQFRVWVLARGALVERGDPFLSPHFPVVEDPAPGS
jgi:hypothetical protein